MHVCITLQVLMEDFSGTLSKSLKNQKMHFLQKMHVDADSSLKMQKCEMDCLQFVKAQMSCTALLEHLGFQM